VTCGPGSDLGVRVDRLGVSLKGLREAGWRPIVVFASATVVNIVVALGLATVLFGNFQIG
jgi:hypothetical protein